MRRALHDVRQAGRRRTRVGGDSEARPRRQAGKLHRAARARPGAGRRPGDAGGISRRCSARRCWCPAAIGPRESARADGGARREAGRHGRARSRNTRRCSASITRTSRRRGRCATLAEAAGDERRSRSRTERIVALDPFDAGRAAGWGRLGAEEQAMRTPPSREFRAALAAGAADKAAAHCDLGESYLLAGRPRRSQEGSARGARNRAELRARAGVAAQRRREDDVTAAAGGRLLPPGQPCWLGAHRRAWHLAPS